MTGVSIRAEACWAEVLMNTDMSAFMGLSPNKDMKNGLIRAESVFMALYDLYYVIMITAMDEHEH